MVDVGIRLDVRPGDHPKAEVIMTSTDKGVGLDVGTMNIVATRKSGDVFKSNKIRDVFYEVDPKHRGSLKFSSEARWIEVDGRLYILGDSAIPIASLFQHEVRRPLAGGLINPRELETAQDILSAMFSSMLGPPHGDGEICCFSIPANPINDPGRNNTFHEAAISQLVGEVGYQARSVLEAHAITLSECASTDFSAIAISFGSGMTNVCVDWQSMTGVSFSVEGGGDYIDRNAAAATGQTALSICQIKEGSNGIPGIDLNDPMSGAKSRLEKNIRMAIKTYYASLIKQVVHLIAEKFHEAGGFAIPSSIPIVCAGGTALPNGFIELFKETFDEIRREFPIPVSEIRLAVDPLFAVSRGLWIASQMVD